MLRRPKRRELGHGELVEANGSTWQSATEVLTFPEAHGAWSRIFYRTRAGEDYRTYPAAQVRVIASARLPHHRRGLASQSPAGRAGNVVRPPRGGGRRPAAAAADPPRRRGRAHTSRHIRDLVGYSGYHSPGDEVTDSAVVSVFDLLYQAYSQRLRPLAARLRNELK